MIAICVKIHKILTLIIFIIIAISVTLLTLLLFKKHEGKISPEHFLKNLGYEFKLIDEKKVVIPEKFNETMQNYNKLQKSQGFDLEKYAGKVCKQLKYDLHKNNSNESNKNNITADVIVHEGNVIGGNLNEKYENKAKKFN